MLFNSFIFLIFGALFFLAWRLVPSTRRRGRWLLLIISSSIFYGWWDWRFLFLLAGTGLVDFLAALGMEKFPGQKKRLLVISMLSNVGVLATFKYLGFFARSANALLHVAGAGWQLPVIDLILPIGISFYTFQSMSYTIDVYKGELRPTRDPLHFFAMISFFPHLVAGPILRARNILPQLAETRRPTEEQRWEGMKLILIGYFKKTVLADNLAPAVNAAFGAHVMIHASLYWWVVAAMFAMQIYCDFSGYTDIARGLAKWMGVEFPQNFNHPYFAGSFRDFWKRWHISLSSWWMEYVYIPLGGSRKGAVRAHTGMWLTMVISGLWHGAAWTFVLWGALHALFLSLERVLKWPSRLQAIPGGRVLLHALLLSQVLVAWVFFRAGSFSQALGITRAMFDLRHPGLSAVPVLGAAALFFLALAIVFEVALYCAPRCVWTPVRSPKFRRVLAPVALALVGAASIYLRGPGSAFIYFQF